MVFMVFVCGGDFMAYFLKKTKAGNRTYLAIYDSFYSHDKKGTAHKCYKSLGSIESLISSGIEDPIAFYEAEVLALNNARVSEKTLLVSDISPQRYLGYFLYKSLLNKLNIKKFIDLFKYSTDFDFSLYSLLSSLIFARAVNPCSKHRTFHEVMPYLYEPCDFSYDQLLSGLAFFGANYEKITELFADRVNEKYGISTKLTYFDCTNFYFEIDREDDFRRKGPSKENSKNPIVGLGLLLDANQIPIGMKMYPGNQSEKPVLREVINELKKQNNITSRTIHVADKGLNCTENITYSLLNGDGYLFSKSIKQLPETEKKWVLLKNDWKEKKDGQGNVLYLYKSCIDEFPYTITDNNGKKKVVTIKEKRLVTYNRSLADKKKREIERMIEKARSLSLSQAKRKEYGDAAKYVNFDSIDEEGKKTGEKVKVSLNKEAIEKDFELAGYNMLVTSELAMTNQDMYSIYHNLWMIEESFKIMKSDLDARPVFLQKEDTIKGHFLICYLTVLLQRILQYKVLENKYSANEIFKFIRSFKIVKTEYRYVNLITKSNFLIDLSTRTSLPLMNYFLSETKIQTILNCKL